MDSSQLNLNTVAESSLLQSQFLNPEYLFNQGVLFFRYLYDFTFSKIITGVLNTYLIFLAIFFTTLIFYCVIRLFEIRAKEKKHLEHEIAEYAHHQAEREKKLREGEGVSTNPRWREVLHLLFSTNKNDWRLSVIEADAMLEALLGESGFKGENLGEKLKAAGEQDFRQLNNAWEVHTVRNRIAHEGSAFELSHYEAKRVIALYEQIFREFGYI